MVEHKIIRLVIEDNIDIIIIKIKIIIKYYISNKRTIWGVVSTGECY